MVWGVSSYGMGWGWGGGEGRGRPGREARGGEVGGWGRGECVELRWYLATRRFGEYPVRGGGSAAGGVGRAAGGGRRRGAGGGGGVPPGRPYAGDSVAATAAARATVAAADRPVLVQHRASAPWRRAGVRWRGGILGGVPVAGTDRRAAAAVCVAWPWPCHPLLRHTPPTRAWSLPVAPFFPFFYFLSLWRRFFFFCYHALQKVGMVLRNSVAGAAVFGFFLAVGTGIRSCGSSQ